MSYDSMTADLRVISRSNILKFQDRSGQFVASLETELFRAHRYERPLSMISLNVLGTEGAERQTTSARQLYFENKLRRFASDLLRMPDFWGRVDRETFAIVFPETPLIGATRAVERLVESRPFVQLVASGGWRVHAGAAESAKDIISVETFVAAAKANTVWRSEGDA